MKTVRELLGDSVYAWTSQLTHMLEVLWNSRLFWRLATLLLLVWLLAGCRRRPR